MRVFVLMCCLLGSLAHATEPSTRGAKDDVAQQLREYLFNAARAGDTAILNEFIEAGFDLNSQDGKGYTALILAAYNGHGEVVSQLIEAGADPCVEDKRGNTALMGAIFKGELRIARRLLASECSPNQRNNAGQTPAMYAALFQRTEILDALREQGADLNAQDGMGNTVENLLQGEFKQGPISR